MPLKAAILLSRQNLRPCAADAWVRGAVRAIDWLALEGHALVSSVGMNTWELALALASSRGLETTLILPTVGHEPDASKPRELARQFDLNPSRTRLVAMNDCGGASTKHALMQHRDATVVATADILVPISVRKSGTMDRLIADAANAGKRIDRSFQIEPAGASPALGYAVDPGEVSPETEAAGNRLLIHWTRAANGPWPTERCLDYYLSLARSPEYPRGALHGLQNIVASRRIIASSRHLPGGVRAVSFSDLAPREAAPLMRWRARYRQMSFEPYGVGFPRALAEELGVGPVVYSDSRPGLERWRTQSIGRLTDWRQECEYRFPGDFDFAAVPSDQLVCFCRYVDEAKALTAETGLRAVPMTSAPSSAP